MTRGDRGKDDEAGRGERPSRRTHAKVFFYQVVWPITLRKRNDGISNLID